MADARRFAPIDLILLAVVLALAAGARAGYVMTCADGSRNSGPLRVTDARPSLDQAGFKAPAEMRGSPEPTDLDALIDSVSKGQGLKSVAPFAPRSEKAGFGPVEEETAHVSPGYPYLVGLLGRLSGEDTLDSIVRWVQVGLGSLTAVFYFLFARRAFRSLAVGTIAGVLAALNPFWVIGVAAIDDSTLASFALAACLFLGSQAGEKGGAFTSLLLGLALAGVALVRAALLPFSFAMLVWFLLRSRGLPRGWLCALLAFLGFANGLAPWTVRNYQVFGEPVPITTSAYLHLWIGNNPKATGGPATEAMYRVLETKPAEGHRSIEVELRQTPKQTERYNKLAREVAQEMRDRPVDTVQRRMMAALYFFFGQQGLTTNQEGLPTGTFAEVAPGGESQMSEAGELSWLADTYPIVLQVTVVVLFLLALLGWRWSYGWRWESFPAVLAMIWVPLPYILSHAEGLSGPRMPLDGVLICFAAFAIGCLVPTVREDLLDAPGAGPPVREEV